MGRSREFRLHQKERKVERAYKILKSWKIREADGELRIRAKKMADNMKCTQCQCCCNIRRSLWYKGYHKLTKQEQKNLLSFEEGKWE